MNNPIISPQTTYSVQVNIFFFFFKKNIYIYIYIFKINDITLYIIGIDGIKY